MLKYYIVALCDIVFLIFFFNFKIFFIYGTTVDFKKLNLTEKI